MKTVREKRDLIRGTSERKGDQNWGEEDLEKRGARKRGARKELDRKSSKNFLAKNRNCTAVGAMLSNMVSLHNNYDSKIGVHNMIMFIL